MGGARRLGGLLVVLALLRVLYRAAPFCAPRSPDHAPSRDPRAAVHACPPDPGQQQQQRLRAAAIRLGIAALLCFVALLLRQWAANDEPSFRASLVALESLPGAPITVAGARTSAPETESPPPIDSTFGRLSVERLTSGRPGTVLIHVVVAPAECHILLEAFGGECGGRSAPPRTSGEVELSMMTPGTVMSADFWLSDPGKIEMATAGPLTQQGVPTGWTLESDSQTTQVDLFCGESTLVIAARQEKAVQCAFGGAHYVLPIRSDEDVQPTVGLGEVSSFNADLEGRSALMTVGEGELSREGEFETLASAKPLDIGLQGSQGNPVEVAAHAQGGAGQFSLAMSAAHAQAISWEGEDHTRSRLDRQPELAYALLGVLAGFALVALADFLFVLLARRPVGW
jgi:hypothetical protein